jgi:hypothetical protein
VRIISQIPWLTRPSPLGPHKRRIERPRDEVGIMRGIFSIERIYFPYHLFSTMKDKGIAMHTDTKVDTEATMIDVDVALVKAPNQFEGPNN